LLAGDHLLKVTPSIGVQVFPFEKANPHTVMRNADAAMYLAKSQGPNSATYYDHKLSHEIDLRLETEQALQSAIKHMDQFKLYFQPQYSGEGQCVGAEALLRWDTPNRKISSPGLFIPVAEKTGLMMELGKWIIRQACVHLHELQQSGFPQGFKRVAVNVSAIQFNQVDFVSYLSEMIREFNVDPEHLELELTESALVKNLVETVQKMKQVRDMGIAIAIDDFGTGYSSLAYLARFPISTLKIDQAFVRNIHRDKINNAIVEAIMGLGKNLGFMLIAEGVETEQELIYLKAKGCQFFQGYYFSHPLDFDGFKKLLFPAS
jgi:EAL domain-containing protein (putative c-di-GMP-specific phosphodiesterase class I)